MAEGRHADRFGLAIGLREKDRRYCLRVAVAMDTGMSVCDAAHRWYRTATEEGVAGLDDSALLEVTAAHKGTLPRAEQDG